MPLEKACQSLTSILRAVTMSDREYIFYDAATWFLSAVVDVFFREVQTRGLHKTPDSGPIFFVAAPHCNQFFDPIVLNRHCHRRILYLCAKKSYDQLIVGGLARGLRSSKDRFFDQEIPSSRIKSLP